MIGRSFGLRIPSIACETTSGFTSSISHRFIHSQSNATSLDRKIHDVFIIGAGCVGQSLTASLLNSNTSNRVFLIGKTASINKICEKGITITGAIEKSFQPNNTFIPTDTIDPDFLKQHHVHTEPIVFLSTKNNEARASLTPFTSTLLPLCPTVVCLQNGLGIEEEIGRILPSPPATILKGHVFGAMHHTKDSLFAYKGRIIVGTDHLQTATHLREMFSSQESTIFDLEITQDILQSIYPKVIINCVCNPLTIIFNQNLGIIRDQQESLIRSICYETYQIALSQGIVMPPREQISALVLDTMSTFSNHYSSMYLDLQAGKKTEIHYINGAIVKIAQEKGADAPLNRLLVEITHNIERKRMHCQSVEEFYATHALYLEEVKIQLIELSKRLYRA